MPKDTKTLKSSIMAALRKKHPHAMDLGEFQSTFGHRRMPEVRYVLAWLVGVKAIERVGLGTYRIKKEKVQ